MKVSVVIPTCDEAAHLPATLRSLEGQAGPLEIIVVDAGSTDATGALAAATGATVIASPRRHRAVQMNAGAAAAEGDVLLFLHADTQLAADALRALRAAMADPATVGGGFARRYASRSPLLRVTCALAEARTRIFGWFLGDQAMFARREVFEKLGGFREWDMFEDLDLARRLAQRGRVATLRPPVVSAARRFASRGPLRTTLRDLGLTLRYLTAEWRGEARKVTRPEPARVAP